MLILATPLPRSTKAGSPVHGDTRGKGEIEITRDYQRDYQVRSMQYERTIPTDRIEEAVRSIKMILSLVSFAPTLSWSRTASLVCYKPRSARQGYGLGTVGDPQAAQDGGYMQFDRAFGQAQPVGDFLVGKTMG